MKIPKWMTIMNPRCKDGVVIKRWALPIFIWKTTKNHGCTLKLCGINISFLIRPILVIMFLFRAKKL